MLRAHCQKLSHLKWPFQIPFRFNSTKEIDKQDPEWNNATPYEKIPGPTKFGLIRGFMPGGKYHGLQITDMHRAMRSDFGNIVRIPGLMGRSDTVLTFKPEIFEKVFRTEGQYPVRRGLETFIYYRKVVRPEVFGDMGGLLSESGSKWLDVRSKVNPVLLQPKVVKMYIDKVDQVAKEFIGNIKTLRKPETNEVPNTFGHELNRWALESIGIIALDERLGVLMDDNPNSDGSKIIESVKNFFILAYELDVAVSIWKYYKTKKFKKLMGVFDQMTETIMKYVDRAVVRLDTKGKLGDESDRSVLEKLLLIDRRVAIVMAFDMLLAGVDTTSSSLVSCLYHLSQNPDKQAKLREEIRKCLPEKNSEFTTEIYNHMPYIKACYKEALRMNPVVSGDARGTGKDVVLEGYQVPKGVEVAMACAVLQNDAEYFVQPEKFIPERWLKDSGEVSAKATNPFVYLPFGFGPRSCIGRRLAEMEVVVILARLIREFEIEYHYGPIKYSTTSIILSPDSDLKFKFVDLKQ